MPQLKKTLHYDNELLRDSFLDYGSIGQWDRNDYPVGTSEKIANFIKESATDFTLPNGDESVSAFAVDFEVLKNHVDYIDNSFTQPVIDELDTLFGNQNITKATMVFKAGAKGLNRAAYVVDFIKEVNDGQDVYSAIFKVGAKTFILHQAATLASVATLAALAPFAISGIAATAVVATVAIAVTSVGGYLLDIAVDNIIDAWPDSVATLSSSSIDTIQKGLTIRSKGVEMEIKDGIVTLDHLPIDEVNPNANILDDTARYLNQTITDNPLENETVESILLKAENGSSAAFLRSNNKIEKVDGTIEVNTETGDLELGKKPVEIEVDKKTGHFDLHIEHNNKTVIIHHFKDGDYNISLSEYYAMNWQNEAYIEGYEDLITSIVTLDDIADNIDTLAQGFTKNLSADALFDDSQLKSLAEDLNVSINTLKNSLTLKFEKALTNRFDWVMDFEKLEKELGETQQELVNTALNKLGDLNTLLENKSEAIKDKLLSNSTVSYAFSKAEDVIFEYAQFEGDLSNFINGIESNIENKVEEEIYKIKIIAEDKVVTFIKSKSPFDLDNLSDIPIVNKVENLLTEFKKKHDFIAEEIEGKIDKVTSTLLGEGKLRGFVDTMSKFISENQGLSVDEIGQKYLDEFKDKQIDSTIDKIGEKVGVEKLTEKYGAYVSAAKDLVTDIFNGGFEDLNNEEIADKLLQTIVEVAVVQGAKAIGTALGGPVGGFIGEIIGGLIAGDAYIYADESIKDFQKLFTDVFKSISELDFNNFAQAGIDWFISGAENIFNFAKNVIDNIGELLDLSDAEKPAEESQSILKDDGVSHYRFVVNTNSNVLRAGDGREDDLFGVKDANVNDRLLGSNVKNSLLGDGGDDFIDGKAGDDMIIGGTGRDMLLGGAGNDAIIGDKQEGTEGGADQIYAGTGDDQVLAGAGNDEVWGEAGNDILLGDTGDDLIYGGAGHDNIEGGTGNDTLFGGKDKDQLSGQEGDDWLFGNAGNDLLQGGIGNDILKGGSGDDQLFGGAEDDELIGGTGDDILYGDDGDDILVGGSGVDILVGGKGRDKFIFNDTHKIEALRDKNAFDIIKDFDTKEDSILVRINDRNVTHTIVQTSTGSMLLFTDGRKIFLEGTPAHLVTDTHINYEIQEASARDIQNYQDSLGIAELQSVSASAYTSPTNPHENLYTHLMQTHDLFKSEIPESATNYDTANYWYKEIYESVYARIGLVKVKIGRKLARYDLMINNHLANSHLDNTFLGTLHNNTLRAGAGDDFVHGIGGNNRIYGESGDDLLHGAHQADTLDGGEGNDILEGNGGNDVLISGGGHNILKGSDGNDRLVMSGKNDVALGGTGSDTFDIQANGTREVSLLDFDAAEDTISFFNEVGQSKSDLYHAHIGGIADALYHRHEKQNMDAGRIYNIRIRQYIEALSEHRQATIVKFDTVDFFVNEETNTVSLQLSSNNGADTLTLNLPATDTVNLSDYKEILAPYLLDPTAVTDNGQTLDAIYTKYLPGIEDALYHRHNKHNIDAGRIYEIRMAQLQDEIAQYHLSKNTDTTQLTLSYENSGVGVEKNIGAAFNKVIGSHYDDILTVSTDVDAKDGDDTIYLSHDSAVIADGGKGHDTFHIQKPFSNQSYIDQSKVLKNFNVDEDKINLDNFTKDDIYKLSVKQVGATTFSIQHKDVGTIVTIESNNEKPSSKDIELFINKKQLILGSTGYDMIEGSDGDDIIIGGLTHDIMSGGDGNDIFVYNSFSDTSFRYRDSILDFKRGQDKIDLSQLGLKTIDQLRIYDEHDNGDINTIVTVKNQDFMIRLVSQHKLDRTDFIFSGTQGTAENDTLSITPTGFANNNAYGFDGDDIITGSHLRDIIFGGDGDDIITGGLEHDLLYGGQGNDTFVFQTANDSHTRLRDSIIDFEQGKDTIDLTGLQLKGIEDIVISYEHHRGNTATIITSKESNLMIRLEGNYTLTEDDFKFYNTQYGSRRADEMTGTDISEKIDGLDGNDTILGGLGNDRLYGNNGHDILKGEDGDDVLSGGEGNDKIYGDDGNDYLSGGNGNDYIKGETGQDKLHGNEGNDRLYGGDGNDTIDAGSGDDFVYSGAGDDILIGGAGDDVLRTGQGNDSVTGGMGKDYLSGGNGQDVFIFQSSAESTKSNYDEIDQFTLGEDSINLSGLALKGFQDLQITHEIHPTTGAYTYVSINNEDFMIEIKGTHEFGNDDFIF